MTYAELAQKQRETINALLEKRKAESDKVLAVRTACMEGEETRDPSDAEAQIVRSAQVELATIDGNIQAARESLAEFEHEAAIVQVSIDEQRDSKRYSPAVVGNEPTTYNEETSRQGVSFFRDAWALTQGFNLPAVRRQERYATELEFQRQQQRATTTSSFAGLIPPQYLVDQYAILARAGRPLANTLQRLPLPADGMSLIIPRGTIGASAAVQASENSTVSTTDEVWGNVTVPVATIAGHAPVSRQSLERGTPGIDSIIFADLVGAYAVALDTQVISGTGSSGQMLGILNTGGIGLATAMGSAATAALFLTKLAGQISTVETTRFLAPDTIYMHSRRWNWLTQLVDGSQRPLVVPNANGPFNSLATFDSPADTPSAVPVGSILGLPVITDANLPTSVGTGPEDVVIVARRADLLLWEDGDGTPTELRFEQTLGTQLTVELVAYGYAAFTAGRYPTAVGTIGGNATIGNGLVAPTF